MSTRKSIGNRRAQGLTEYIIVVALVAIAAIAVVNVFGQQVRAHFATIVAAMCGNSRELTADLANQAEAEARTKTLKTYATKLGSQDK